MPGAYFDILSKSLVPLPIEEFGYSLPASIKLVDKFLKYIYAIVNVKSGLNLI